MAWSISIYSTRDRFFSTENASSLSATGNTHLSQGTCLYFHAVFSFAKYIAVSFAVSRLSISFSSKSQVPRVLSLCRLKRASERGKEVKLEDDDSHVKIQAYPHTAGTIPLIPAFVLPLARSFSSPPVLFSPVEAKAISMPISSTSEHELRKVFLNNLNGVLMPMQGFGIMCFPETPTSPTSISHNLSKKRGEHSAMQ